MYHSFLIHSSADGHLGCFHGLAMINSAAMNIGVHVSLSDLVSSVCMPRSGIAYNQPFMHENFCYFQDWEDAEILCIMRTRLTSEIPGKTCQSSFHRLRLYLCNSIKTKRVLNKAGQLPRHCGLNIEVDRHVLFYVINMLGFLVARR